MTFVEIPEPLPFSLNTALHKFEVREGTLKHALRIKILGILESSGSKECETVRSDVNFKLFRICATLALELYLRAIHVKAFSPTIFTQT